jgi:hypothetical protein
MISAKDIKAFNRGWAAQKYAHKENHFDGRRKKSDFMFPFDLCNLFNINFFLDKTYLSFYKQNKTSSEHVRDIRRVIFHLIPSPEAYNFRKIKRKVLDNYNISYCHMMTH